MTPYLFIRFCPVCFNYTMDHLCSQEVIVRLFLRILCISFFHQLRYFRKTADDQIIIVRHMRYQTVGAVLDALVCILKVSTAALTECIQRTVTEQAVEMFRIRAGMAGEIFTFPVAEKFIMLRLLAAICFSHVHYSSTHVSILQII